MNKEDFENILQAAKLSEKTYKFFENLVNTQSKTCGDIVKSYHAAGYTENPTSKYTAYRIYNSKKFQSVLIAYRAYSIEKGENREFTVKERVTQDLQYIIERSKFGGDLSTMRQAVMDLAKLHGLLVDKIQAIDPVTEDEINKTKQIEAACLAESRLLGNGQDDIIEGEIIDVDDAECPSEVSKEEDETAVFDEKAGFYDTDSMTTDHEFV